MTVLTEGRRAAEIPLARGTPFPDRIRALGGCARTIRGKILLAFGLLATIVCLLGFAGMKSVGGSGDVVVESFNKPLASISYARYALARFTEMQAATAKHLADGSAPSSVEFDRRMIELARQTATYLELAAGASTSLRAEAAARDAVDTVVLWDAKRRLIGLHPTAADRVELSRLGDLVLVNFERLVAMTAEDGLGAQQRALQAVSDYRRLTLIATVLALIVGAIVAFMLMRAMTRPIAEASRAANRIASGELDVAIDNAGRSDEMGVLLAAMAVMRDNIRVMMQREVAAKHAAQNDLAAAIESAPAAMILVDGGGRVSIRNAKALDFFPDHAEALTPGESFTHGLAAAFAQPVGELQLSDGRWIKLSRQMTDDGGFVAVAAEITALKDRERALIAARDIAEAASRAKTDFFANMSHELRTPLNAVIGFSEIISSEILGPVGQRKYKEFAEDILFSGRHLLQIINHVLDIAKLQWGKMEIERKPTALADVTAEAVRIARGQAQTAGVTLDMTVRDAIPPVAGDHTRLRQVMLNLLSNAIKFTPRDGRVDVVLRRNGGVAEIEVRDTGIGMNEADIPMALEPFQQVDSSIARKYGGTGLGLPLCKLFVELHGGRFAIASAPDHGTAVTVTLPLSV